MSQMSLIERKVRYSTAYSLLNKIRHLIQKRETSLSDSDHAIMNDVFEMLTGEDNLKLTAIFKNSLHNMGEYTSASSLQLMDAMADAAKQNGKETFYYVNILKDVLNKKSIGQEATDETVTFLTDSMNSLDEKIEADELPVSYIKGQGL